jgi:hypothetical protein
MGPPRIRQKILGLHSFHRVLPSATMLALVFSAGGLLVTLDRAEGCPAVTEQVRQAQMQTRSPLAPSPPDCRAYEQVSPVGKNGVDASGESSIVQASPIGTGVTFFSVEPSPQTVGSAEIPSYLGTRTVSGSEWLTQGLEALAPPGSVETVEAVTEDLGKTIIYVGSTQAVPPCEPTVQVCGAPKNSNYYVHNNVSGAFQLLAEVGEHTLQFADASRSGSRLLFDTAAKLTPEAGAGVNLYEWNEGEPPAERIGLVGLIPPLGNGTCGPAGPACEAATTGSSAGPGGPGAPPEPYYTQNTISEDGSRIFFSDLQTGVLYMREPDAGRTIQVSAAGGAFWRAATRDGSYAFYTEGNELYRFNLARFAASGEPESIALTEAREQLTTGAEGVLGVVGISETDGAYVHFVAPGVLAGNENANNEKAVKGEPNLYVWREGEPTPTFIARLAKPSAGAPADEPVWRDYPRLTVEAGPSGGERSSRVSSDGRYLLFSSQRQLTSYPNDGAWEFYLYDGDRPLSPLNPRCVTCNLAGRPPTGEPRLSGNNSALTVAPSPRNPFFTHNLSSDGRRVFFETTESLVAGDANFQSDVYEWEADGEGTCESEAQNGGCIYLISTGQSSERSYLGDVSADGGDVFFFTRQSLVGQDDDSNVDLYDARVDGGIPGQSPPPAAAPCAEEATCRGPSSNAPATFAAPTSTTFSGSGNLTEPAGVKAPVKTAAQIRAERLARALKACRSKPKAERKRCETLARRRYGASTRKAKKATVHGGPRP